MQISARAPRYRGFTSVGSRGPATEVFDVEVVKSDLMNHLNTRYREVPGRPGFGCAVHQALSSPHDSITEAMVQSEVERVIRYDPRLKLIQTKMTSDRRNHSITLECEVEHVELGLREFLNFTIGTSS